jgi:hypothetical protein
VIERMASIGLTAGRDFDPSKLSAFDRAAVEAVPKLAQQKMLERFKEQPTINGWIYFGSSVANWGTDYVQRALCNMLGPGWNLPADAVYPVSEKGPEARTTTVTTSTSYTSRKVRCRQSRDSGR